MSSEWYLVGATIATAIITASYFGIHLHQLRKENKRTALVERLNRFNQPESKRGRKIIMSTLYTKEGDFSGKLDELDLFKFTLAELDTTGHLIKHGYVDKNQFLELVAAIIIVCFESSKPYIDYIRDKRHQKETKYYAKQFEWLYDQATKYWKNHVSSTLPTKDDLGEITFYG